MCLGSFRLLEDSRHPLHVLTALSQSVPSAALAPVPRPEQPTSQSSSRVTILKSTESCDKTGSPRGLQEADCTPEV